MQINTTSDALDNLNKKLGGADIEIEPSTNKVDALKKIYKTLGGTDDVAGLSTVYQVLEKITEVAAAGGGGGGGFEIVEVKFVRAFGTTGNIRIVVPNVEHWDALNIDVPCGDTNIEPEENEKTVQIILYNGYACCYCIDWGLEGDNYDDENEAITGAGTINII